MKVKFTLMLASMLILGCGEFEREKETTPQGRTGKVGAEGPAGQDGRDGKDGRDGRDASPCSVVQHLNGATISCPDGTFAEITHGANGEDGQAGAEGAPGAEGPAGVDGKDGLDNTEPVYIGYYCSRTVLRIGGINYVIHSALIPLNSAWLKISNNCELRLRGGTIQTRDPS